MSTLSTAHHGRILIVDDEPQVLAVAKAILNAHGFEVETTESGEHALEMIRVTQGTLHAFVVCILDLTMPGGLSGFEAVEEIKKIAPGLSVIACSGYFQEDARDLCQAIGFSDVLQKPYALEHLVATVRRCLSRDRRGQPTASFQRPHFG